MEHGERPSHVVVRGVQSHHGSAPILKRESANPFTAELELKDENTLVLEEPTPRPKGCPFVIPRELVCERRPQPRSQPLAGARGFFIGITPRDVDVRSAFLHQQPARLFLKPLRSPDEPPLCNGR